MFMKKLAAMAALCFVFSIPAAFAQMEMGAPAEMKNVASLVGTWEGTMEYRMDPSSEWLSSDVKMVVETILNGCAQRTHFSGMMMGQQFNGESTLTYDRNSKKYQSSWVDSMSANQVYSTGEYKDGKLVMQGKNAMGAMVFLMRDTTHVVDENVVNWQMEMSMDDGANWFVGMKATYKRK